jgi:cell division protein FtsB
LDRLNKEIKFADFYRFYITDQFRKLLKDDTNYKEKLDSSINEEFSHSTFLTYDTFGKYDETNFFINNDTMTIYVSDKEKSTILSCYKVDFDLSEDGNREFLNLLYKELELSQRKVDINNDELLERENQINFSLQSYEREMKELESRIKIIKDSIQNFNDRLGLIKKEKESLNYNVKNTLSKIIYSYGYKRDLVK